MATIYSRHRMPHLNDNTGFSLVELMVVLVIVGILALGVVMSFTDPTAKVKAAAFEMRGDFNLAKAESVKENQDVLIDFIKGAEDGYQICFDTNGDGNCAEADDDIIKEVMFRKEVQFYDFADGTAFPSDGPSKTPFYTSQPAGKSLVNEDGVVFTDNEFEMRSNGTCDKDGAVIIYYPAEGNKRKIRGKAYATVIESANTGKVTLSRWRHEIADHAGTSHDERWSRK